MKFLLLSFLLLSLSYQCQSINIPNDGITYYSSNNDKFNPNETIREVAADLSFLFGMAYAQRSPDNQYAIAFNQVAKTQFNLFVAENNCKLFSVQPQRGVFDFGPCDQILKVARSLKASFRGHTLVWRSFQPTWLQDVAKNSSRQEMESILVNHVRTVLNYYKGESDIIAWDVVNEALDDDQSKTPAGQYALNQDPIWYKNLPDYVEIAFRTARETAPKTKLFYNDYSIEYAGKFKALVNMINDLKKKNITIDGVGFQMHTWITTYPTTDWLKSLFRNLTAMGLEVQITEMDVKCPDPCDQVKLADAYVSALRACVETKGCTAFLIWGATDYYSWMGSLNHPLPWDDLGLPKLAEKEMLKYLQTVRNQTLIPTPIPTPPESSELVMRSPLYLVLSLTMLLLFLLNTITFN